ncbi:DUF5314 domain-containing protein NDAI_0I02120 [Naumovozyma dairenensis CBS 421]|uniref:Retrovirus-related Pol polyprotein from transposon TNT 1-94-like beta-barrel domain-containing protein n=1 Tax=Naumovozyma dairenensis (strain ATCC 10597 / BCRC 20456 / CBS 421 / NBRC 0211 / NRRL Y-12639) TaxID=1071378 RepID=G0WG70_NAUDC|nr:hypothetical protein NDAI_0I02120 [Naumovozyma dairenensis CBS 421]CCD26781.1 hypothetical protein NDAI_0I02120 [Naumovozyma dairenensis CBS 421]
MCSPIVPNTSVDIGNLAQQVMSPSVSGPNALTIKLTDASNYQRWFNKLTNKVLTTSVYWFEYLQNGGVVDNIQVFANLSSAQRITVASCFNVALIMLIRNSCSGTAQIEVSHYFENSDDENAIELLQWLKAKFSFPTVSMLVENFSNTSNMINTAPIEKRDWAVKLSSIILTDATEDETSYSTLLNNPTFHSYRKKMLDRLAASLMVSISPSIKEKILDRYGDDFSISTDQVTKLLERKAANSGTENNQVVIAHGKYNAKNKHKTSNRECAVCKGPHSLENCKIFKSKFPQAHIFQKAKKKTQMNNSHYSDGMNDSSWMAISDSATTNSNATSSSALSSNHWIFDTGCTSHMTPHRSVFSEFHTDVSGSVKGAGGSVRIKGHGTVKLNGITLNDVLYVPDLPVNLISIRKATQTSKNQFVFTNEKVDVFNENHRLVSSGSLCVLSQVAYINRRIGNNRGTHRV